MRLLIDIGNTRVKWATCDDRGIGAMRAASYANWTEHDVRQHVLMHDTPVAEVLVSNVGGNAIARLIGDTVRAAWAVEPVFVRARAFQCGVRNGYRQPEQLGVDRWLSVLAAYDATHAAVCVVSVGTATTVDAVTSAGEHLGGVIVPGPELMIASLMKNTSDIADRARDDDVGASLFADSTLSAIYQGANYALAALVERAAEALQRRCGVSPAIVLTGGASTRIDSTLRLAYRTIPDLVLRGLALVAQESKS